jgi:ComEC/Rec2-related protein
MLFLKRSPKRFRVIIALVCFCFGIILGAWLGSGAIPYFIYAALAFLGLFFLLRSYTVGLFFLGLSLLIMGYWWASTQVKQFTIKEPLHYVGRVELVSLQYAKSPRQRAVLELKDGQKAGSRIRAYIYDWTYKTGSELSIDTTIKPSQYTSDRGYSIIGLGNTVKVIKQTAPPNMIYTLRHALQSRVGACLPEPYASLAVGLITGVNDSFDAEFKEDLQRSGTTHLVAVSGYNVMIVALLLQRLGRRKSEVVGFVLACLGLVAYILLAGAGASIMRGVIMAFLVLFSSLVGRVTHRLVLLLLCAALLSLLSPLGMLYSLSWQLSFLAFAGILFFSPLITPSFAVRFGALGATFGETVSAQLMVEPLLILRFGMVSLISPLVNVAVLGFVPFAMALSALQAVVAMLSIEAGRLMTFITYPLLVLIIKPIQWSGNLPFATYSFASFPLMYFCITYGCIVSLFLYLTRKSQKESSV